MYFFLFPFDNSPAAFLSTKSAPHRKNFCIIILFKNSFSGAQLLVVMNYLYHVLPPDHLHYSQLYSPVIHSSSTCTNLVDKYILKIVLFFTTENTPTLWVMYLSMHVSSTIWTLLKFDSLKKRINYILYTRQRKSSRYLMTKGIHVSSSFASAAATEAGKQEQLSKRICRRWRKGKRAAASSE